MVVKLDLTGLWRATELIRTSSNWFGCSPATLSGGLDWLQSWLWSWLWSWLHPLGVKIWTEPNF